MKESFLVKGVTVVDCNLGVVENQDVHIVDGTIKAIGSGLNVESKQLIKGHGLLLTPGLTDMHTHLRDLGQKDKEDLASGTKAAAAGGFTSVVAMANTDPPVDNGSTLTVLLRRIQESALIEVLPVASLTKGLAGAELTNMVELADMGAVAFSDDGMCVNNLAVLKRALEYARITGRCVISHAEDKDLSGGGSLHECCVSASFGIKGIPAASETAAVAREIEIVRTTKAPYHFTHLSCQASVELVRRAKHDNLPITADVTPHHLTLSVDDIEPFDTNYKMKPPLRLPSDQAALVAGLKDGTIDAIATDHAPHTRLDKDTTIEDAAVGIIGLETAWSLCYERLVTSGTLSLSQFVNLFTSGPARALSLTPKTIKIGQEANLTLFDPAHRWTYDPRSGNSKSKNTPFAGRTLTGKTVLTVFRGQTVYRDESYFSSPTH